MPSSSPLASPQITALPTATSSPPALPRTQVDFSCRLPVYTRDGTQVKDSFIDFPNLAATAAGQGGIYYDRPIARWLPVTRQAVSPEGTRYAFTEGWSAEQPAAPRVHIVDASSGADIRVVSMPDAQPYVVADYTAGGVYVVIRADTAAPGVWRIDPNKGSVAKVSAAYYQPAGPGFIGAVDRRDPSPYKSALSGQEQPNRIDRRDARGRAVSWLYQPGRGLAWVVLPGPALLVMGRSRDETQRAEQVEFWLVEGPGRWTRLAAYSGSDPSPYRELEDGFGNAIADAHGTWIGTASGLYLMTPDAVLLRVLDQPAYPANTCA